MTLRTHLGLTPEIYKFSCHSCSNMSRFFSLTRVILHTTEQEIGILQTFLWNWSHWQKNLPNTMSKDSLGGTCGWAERESCKDQAEVLPSALVTPVLHPDPQPDRIQVPDEWGGGEPSPWGSPCLTPSTGSRGPTGSHSASDRPRMTRHCRRLRTLQERHRASTLEKKQPPIVEASFSPS